MSSPGRPLPALVELVRTRLLEFVREPEGIFWVIVFPVAMALALGFAFQNKAPEAITVGINGAETLTLRRSLAGSKVLKPESFSSVADGRAALRTGMIAL